MTLPSQADLQRRTHERAPPVLELGRLSLSRPLRDGVLRPALVDREARTVRYLRLSVTDRCNFRCVYCMPEEGLPFSPRAEVLSFEEITRLVRIFVSLGVNKVRLTGGEPLLRRDLPDLVASIAAIPGVDDLSLSTNGFQLAALAKPLKDAGLRRVNVSLDTLDPERFRSITRTGELDRVLEGLSEAHRVGLTPIKLNAVILRGQNDDELPALVRFAADRGFVLRFIEYMPVGVDGFWSDESFVSVDTMRQSLAREFDLTPAPHDPEKDGGGPARHAWLSRRDGRGQPVRVGFITALSENFCAACNRVRLTATGKLQECLAFAGTLSLRDVMRAGASDDTLAEHIAGALGTKGPGHRFDRGQYTLQSMSLTGG